MPLVPDDSPEGFDQEDARTTGRVKNPGILLENRFRQDSGQDELDQIEVTVRTPGWKIIAERMASMLYDYRADLENDPRVRTVPGRAGELQGSVTTVHRCLNLPAILMDEARKGVTAEAKAARKR